jgi:predicted transcriptional regulator of viral defense system
MVLQMGRILKFVSAEKQIKFFFSSRSKRVFSGAELSEILETNRSTWDLSVNTNSKKFIDQLLKKEILRRVVIELGENDTIHLDRYLFENPSPYEIAVTLKPKAYLSHYSAVLLNSLTTQVPKTIYITNEQSKKLDPDRDSLTQANIDKAFSHPQRMSGLKGKLGDHSVILLNGMYTNRAGVSTPTNIRHAFPVTNLERTLIDITVRPNYAGGVFAVLEAYRGSLESLSVNKLIATLRQINFIYPYHQSIGFYLERAGYRGKQLDLLRKEPMPFDFYLTYQIEEKEYSKDWKLYYPKGM